MVQSPTFHERATFATASRLASCIVTESLVRALYIPISHPKAVGVGVILSGPASAKSPHRMEIGLLDPLDMFPLLLEIAPADSAKDESPEHADLRDAILAGLSDPGWALDKGTRLTELTALGFWEKLGTSIGLEPNLQAEIKDELASAILWQAYSYEHPPPTPTFDSPSIAWEQSIVDGHPTHPMHKMRHFLPPIPQFIPGGYDLYSPRVRLVAVSKNQLNLTGDFEEQIKPVIEGASKAAGRELDVPAGFVVVPIHELQAHHIQVKFPEAVVFPEEFSVPALAQQSIRSIVLPGTLTNVHLKLGVGIKLTSAVRTISPASAYLGPRFSSQVVPVLKMDPKILTVAKELASVVHAHPDGEIAKHCSAIFRECHENTSEERGERVIVCTSLVESGHAGAPEGVSSVVRVFDLDTEAKRLEWLDEFVRVYFAAFLPAMLENGVAFEAHPQNTLARFSLEAPHRLLGFIVRDFGGIRVHPPTLLATTGVTLDAALGHSIIADTLDDVYARMYHTMIHNHLQQLVRVLGLHYNSKGWDVIRSRLREVIPEGHALANAWLSEEAKTVPGKCFMRMRMVGMYRHHLHGPFPNLLHYTGEEERQANGHL
ncbi:hypothetical protein EWM64_g1073 [Hericium alpestre]|uniref:Aerobactin siderophore biosynthesis IucA/IucC N-terminal domain-containing protein n=1 Tax=Hericium alpestre TaxID=135208 RepID=A0A4Z0A9K7_9AGAM|nr:hypothetical protein EWM64_g1073 [Hericium alpestre]